MHANIQALAIVVLFTAISELIIIFSMSNTTVLYRVQLRCEFHQCVGAGYTKFMIRII